MENPGKSKFSAGMTDFTSVPVSDRAFILMVKDDSMSPDLRSGEWVVVDPDVDPEPGNLVFAVNPETGKPDIRAFADLRQVGGGPSVYELRPANSFYPIWRYESSRPKLLGTLIERRVPLRRLQPKK